MLICSSRLSIVAAFLAASVASAVIQPPPPPPPAAEPPPAVEAPKGVPVPDGPVIEKKELEGGLIIEEIKIGTGYEVKAGGAVVAHYHGTLKDGGKVFDSSFVRGEPATFPLSGVIEGWQKGVPGMKIGGVRRLTIPAKMAYGERGAGADVPPNADLVFVIQLVDALRIEEVKAGEGEPAQLNAIAVTAYTIKDENGKVIEQADAANPYIWLPGEFQAMTYALTGMKKGGKCVVTVPKEFNQTNPGIETKRPSNVPLTIEVEMLNFRNLPQQRRR